jgi:hypothetical protein
MLSFRVKVLDGISSWRAVREKAYVAMRKAEGSSLYL